MTKINAAARLAIVKAAASAHRPREQAAELDKIADAFEDGGIEATHVSDSSGKRIQIEKGAADKVQEVLKSLGYKRIGLPKNNTYVLKKVGYDVHVSGRNASHGFELDVSIRDD